MLAELAKRECLSVSTTVTISAQDELQDLVGLLVEQGKRVTAWLSTTLQQPVDADETTPVEDDSVAALQLTLVHTTEVLRFHASRQIASHASLSISSSDLETVLMGCLLLLATSDDRAGALTLTADILITLLSIAETKDTVVSRFADAALSPEESSSTDKPSQTTSVWDLALWGATLSSTVDRSTSDNEDSKAFAALILNLVQATSSSQPHFLEYSPTPRALLAFLSACVQISTTAVLVAERVGSAGAPPALLDEHGLDEGGQGLEESDVENLEGVLGEMLGLWVADRALAEVRLDHPRPRQSVWSTDRSSFDCLTSQLCSTLLSRPAVFDALSLLSAHSSGPLSRSATSLSNIILSYPHCSPILDNSIRRLPWSTRSSLTSDLDPLPALHLSIVAQAAPAQQVLLKVISLAKLLQSDLSDSTFFELQVWLAQLRHRVEILDEEPGFALLLSETQDLLDVFSEITTVQRDLLARTGSFARDLQAGFDRVATFGTLGKVNTLVLECLRPFFRTTDTRREREQHHADRWLRRTLVQRATMTLAESHLLATYALKPAFLNAFCRPNHRSSFELVVEGQLSQTRSLVWLLGGSGQSVQEDVEDVLSSLLEWTLRDPATTGSSTIELLAYVLRNLDLSRVGIWRKALRAQEMQLSLLALFIPDSDRNELALTLQEIEPSLSDVVLSRSPSSPVINLTALSSASSSTSTVVIPLSSLLAYFHSPVPPNDRHTAFSPSKAASQTFVGSPTTGKTYKQHEFRAPRGVGGAGGERVVSRAPSKVRLFLFVYSLPLPLSGVGAALTSKSFLRLAWLGWSTQHVDEMDPSFPFQPLVPPFSPSKASTSTSMLGVSFTPT